MTQTERFRTVLNSFTKKVQQDPNVIALVLSGSLAYGTVWEKSDIDLTMLVRDGSIPKHSSYSIDEDGIEIHMEVMETKDFKNRIITTRAGEFTHGYLGKGEIVFTKDPALTSIFEENRSVGMEDAMISCLLKVHLIIGDLEKAEKWVTVFDDEIYSQHFLQWCSPFIAEIILLLNGEEPDRESILRASQLEPELMERVYVFPSINAMTVDEIFAQIKYIREFLRSNIEMIAQPVLRYLSDHEVRTVSEINNYFGQNLICTLDFIAESGLIERVTKSSRVFKRSILTVEEIAFFSL